MQYVETESILIDADGDLIATVFDATAQGKRLLVQVDAASAQQIVQQLNGIAEMLSDVRDLLAAIASE